MRRLPNPRPNVLGGSGYGSGRKVQGGGVETESETPWRFRVWFGSEGSVSRRTGEDVLVQVRVRMGKTGRSPHAESEPPGGFGVRLLPNSILNLNGGSGFGSVDLRVLMGPAPQIAKINVSTAGEQEPCFKKAAAAHIQDLRFRNGGGADLREPCVDRAGDAEFQDPRFHRQEDSKNRVCRGPAPQSSTIHVPTHVYSRGATQSCMVQITIQVAELPETCFQQRDW